MTAMLNKIAQIRFSTIISMNPDLQLKKSFENLGYTYQYDYLHPINSTNNIIDYNCDKPLIYNLLGDISTIESTVLTHEDLFKFLEFSIDSNSLPMVLREKISSAHNFIFIGLPFDKWYTQLLVRILQKDTKSYALKHAVNHAKDKDVEMFYKNQFNITCVPNDINEFISELYEHCSNANLLRPISPNYIQISTGLHDEPINKDIWRELAENDCLEDLIKDMLNHFTKKMGKQYGNYETCVNLNSDLKDLNRKFTNNSINPQDITVERSKIRQRILVFLNYL
jgi:hypothetical protein